MSTIKANDSSLSVAEFAAQFNKGQGKTSGATTGKAIDLVNTNIPGVVANMSDSFRQFALSTMLWKGANYGNLEGDDLDYLNNSWLGINHYRSVESPADKKAIAAMIPNKVLTAIDYRTTNIEFTIKELSYADVAPLFSIDESKVTKAMLLEVIKTFTSKLWSEEREETYKVMVEAEEEAKRQYKILYDVGFTDIGKAGNIYVANIDPVKAKEGLPILATAGFKLKDSDFNAETMNIKVIFEKVESSEQQTDI